jgi:hypothetical protein
MCEQSWFWTDDWQEKEREVDNRIHKGEILRFDSIEELLDSLEEDDKSSYTARK